MASGGFKGGGMTGPSMPGMGGSGMMMPGMNRPGSGGAAMPTPDNPDGSGGTSTDPNAKPKKVYLTRTEFIILFLWKEPTPSDTLLSPQEDLSGGMGGGGYPGAPEASR